MPSKRTPPTQMKPELQLTLQLGITLAMLLCGGTLVLSTTGVIPPDPDAGPLTRLLVFGIGLALAWFSVKVLVGTLWLLAQQEGARDPIGALSLGLARLLERIDLKSIGSAALLLPLAFAYWQVLAGKPAWGWSRDALIAAVVIEFLLIHGFVFIVVAVSFARIPERWPRVLGIAALLVLCTLYSMLAWGAGGVWGVASLGYLVLPNLLAFARPPHESGPRVTAAVRWMVQLFTFIAVALLLDHRELRGERNLEVGLGYFALQALVELFRVSEIPLDLAPRWARIPLRKRAAVLPAATEG